MKKKTIQTELRKVHNKWIKTITDKTVQELAAKNSIITGGCIASMLLGEKVNDYDIYFTDKATVLAICNYYKKVAEDIAIKTKTSIPMITIIDTDVEAEEMKKEEDIECPTKSRICDGRIKFKIKSSGIIKFNYDEKVYKENSFLPIFLTSNAITLSDKVQLIVRFYGDVDTIHSNYDFEHCKSSWSSGTGKLIIPAASAEALLARELRYTGSKYPLSSIIRTRKFIKRDWTISAGEYVKMAVQLNQLDLLDVKVLEDQLIGVDTSYFVMFIDEMRKAMEDPNFKLSAGYVCEVIDKIFNDESDESNYDED